MSSEEIIVAVFFVAGLVGDLPDLFIVGLYVIVALGIISGFGFSRSQSSYAFSLGILINTSCPGENISDSS